MPWNPERDRQTSAGRRLEKDSVQQTSMTGETLRLYRNLFVCLVCPVTPSPQIAATPAPPRPQKRGLLAVYEHELLIVFCQMVSPCMEPGTQPDTYLWSF